MIIFLDGFDTNTVIKTYSESMELIDKVLFGVGKQDRLFTADTGVPIDDTLLSLWKTMSLYSMCIFEFKNMLTISTNYQFSDINFVLKSHGHR